MSQDIERHIERAQEAWRQLCRQHESTGVQALADVLGGSEIDVSPKPHLGNWIESDPHVELLIVRQFFDEERGAQRRRRRQAVERRLRL